MSGRHRLRDIKMSNCMLLFPLENGEAGERAEQDEGGDSYCLILVLDRL